MLKLEELQMSIQKRLQSLWHSLQGKEKKELDDSLVQQGRSDDEKTLIAEQCAEIDMEHDLMEELVATKEDPGKWLEKKIEETAIEINPKATQEEIDVLKNAVADSMESEIGEQADELAEEAAIIAGAVEGKETTKNEG